METEVTLDVFNTNSPKETKKLAEKFAKDLKLGDIIALYGDLGAGKTVFIQGIAQGLNIKKKITSPTFVFIKSYPIKIKSKNLIFNHLDLYRSTNDKDSESLGLEEIFTEDSITVIEWADKIKERLPEKRIDVYIKATESNARRITIKGN